MRKVWFRILSFYLVEKSLEKLDALCQEQDQ